ncbi:MAG: ATP-binding cassette domain-containing protein, partial [Microvirgula sp.]
MNETGALPLLDVDQLSVCYGDTPVVDRLSFSLTAGEIGCLLGASGCGKTTVLRAIAGFEPLSAGEIRVDGTVFARRGDQMAAHRRGIGMV